MKKGFSGAAAFCWPIQPIARSAMASEKCQSGLSCGISMGAVFSKSGVRQWLDSPPWNPKK